MPAPTRDPLLDNAKYVAMVLVVVGHAWTDLRVVPAIDAAYAFVYLFHIPVFVILAGFLSRNFTLSLRSLTKLGAALLIPYVLFETLYESLAAWVAGHPAHHNAIAPSWVMWFLMALFMWRLSVPLWRWLGAPMAISIAIVVSLWGGLSTNDDYAWSKTVSLLPFFVIGMYLRREQLDRLRTVPARLGALAIVAMTALACLLMASSFDIGLARWKYSYAELGFGTFDGSVVRLVMMGVALVLSAAFFALIPGERSWFTGLGANTMYSYLLHGATIQAAVAAGLFATAWATTLPGAVFITTAAAAVGTLLMAPAVKMCARPVVEPGPSTGPRPELVATADDLETLWRRPSATEQPLPHSLMR